MAESAVEVVGQVELDFFADGEPIPLNVEKETVGGKTAIQVETGSNAKRVGKTMDTDRRPVGPESVFYAAIELKLTDIRRLRELGIIIGTGDVISVWPTLPNGQAQTFLNEYDHRFQVSNLLRWAKGGELAYELKFLGCVRSAEEFLEELGLMDTIPMMTAKGCVA